MKDKMQTIYKRTLNVLSLMKQLRLILHNLCIAITNTISMARKEAIEGSQKYKIVLLEISSFYLKTHATTTMIKIRPVPMPHAQYTSLRLRLDLSSILSIFATQFGQVSTELPPALSYVTGVCISPWASIKIRSQLRLKAIAITVNRQRKANAQSATVSNPIEILSSKLVKLQYKVYSSVTFLLLMLIFYYNKKLAD